MHKNNEDTLLFCTLTANALTVVLRLGVSKLLALALAPPPSRSRALSPLRLGVSLPKSGLVEVRHPPQPLLSKPRHKVPHFPQSALLERGVIEGRVFSLKMAFACCSQSSFSFFDTPPGAFGVSLVKALFFFVSSFFPVRFLCGTCVYHVRRTSVEALCCCCCCCCCVCVCVCAWFFFFFWPEHLQLEAFLGCENSARYIR